MNVCIAPRATAGLPRPTSDRPSPDAPRPEEPRDRIELAPLAHRKRLRPYVLGGLMLGATVGAVGSLPGALFLGSLGGVVGLAVGSMLVRD